MRLKKGDRVEVMNKKESPVAWRMAEILSGNGHTYHVQYDSYRGIASEHMVETVSRKFVRPCPPLVQGLENFIAGDIVEVFHEYAWKVATILKVQEGKKYLNKKKVNIQAAAVQNQYVVRLLGCSGELVIDESNVRMRQTWNDDRWILIGKSSRGMEDVISSKPSTSNCYQNTNFKIPQSNARHKKQNLKDCKSIQDEAAFWEPNMTSTRTIKRMSPFGSSIVEANNGQFQKLRAVEKDGMKQRVVAAPVCDKVDAVAYPREILGEKNMHASLKIAPDGYNQMERTELNSSDSDACSVGSCSVTDQSPNNFCIPFIPLPWQGTDALCSDAESFYASSSERKSSSLPPKEEVEVSIRRLELRAYRRTLEALYASGPLSWEQEALLTNLRIMLHISNDEHLMELKHLISANTAISVR